MPKNMTFAILEGIQNEMQREKLLTLFCEPAAVSVTNKDTVQQFAIRSNET